MLFDSTEEARRLTAIYRDMGDVELENLAREAYNLTEPARDALRAELRNRELDVPLQDAPVVEDSFNPHGLDVVIVRQGVSVSDAEMVKHVLERAGIASSLDAEHNLKVLDRDARPAAELINRLLPIAAGEEPADELLDACCPECRSIEILFEGGEHSSWSCDACGHQWREGDAEAAEL